MLPEREKGEFFESQMVGCDDNFDENILSADFEDVGDELVRGVGASEY